MAGRAQDDDRAVAEHVLVERQRLDGAAAADPVGKGAGVHALRGLRRRDGVPIALADEQRGFRERRELARVVGVVVADADILHLVGRDLELRELVGKAHLRCVRVRAWHKAGVPHHVFVAVLDDVAAIGEGSLHVLVGERVAPALDRVGDQRASRLEATRRSNTESTPCPPNCRGIGAVK